MIVPATESQALEILRGEGVRHRLLVEPKSIVNGDTYIINGRMLLILIEHNSEQVEAHIAINKRNWRHVHDDINEAIRFIVNLEYSEIWTNVREELKTTINLLKKHNFKVFDTVNGEVLLTWVLKQH